MFFYSFFNLLLYILSSLPGMVFLQRDPTLMCYTLNAPWPGWIGIPKCPLQNPWKPLWQSRGGNRSDIDAIIFRPENVSRAFLNEYYFFYPRKPLFGRPFHQSFFQPPKFPPAPVAYGPETLIQYTPKPLRPVFGECSSGDSSQNGGKSTPERQPGAGFQVRSPAARPGVSV